jgi:hypothetical protein
VTVPRSNQRISHAHQHPPARIKAPPLSFAGRVGDMLFISGIPGFDENRALPDSRESDNGESRYAPALLPEHRLEQFLRAFETLWREDHRSHFADGIVDHVLVVQAAEHAPVEAFPGPVAVMQRQIEQCQRCVIDLVRIEGIGNLLPPACPRYPIQNRARRNRFERG